MKFTIYCGSISGHHAHFVESTKRLGEYLAKNSIDIVYGGGNVGLMGAMADAVLEAGGRVYGVIPEDLKNKEIAHPNLTELTVVADMHERKATMANMADGFVALPGGPGTLEEIFEAWTWAQLGHHSKPCAFYNMNGFYNPLKGMVETMCTSGFIKPEYADMLIHVDTPEALLTAINHYQAPKDKWAK